MMRHSLQCHAQDIRFYRGDRVILDNVSMEMSGGKLVGLLGSNGAGKTTFFDILCGLKDAAEGSISGLSGIDKIAYLTQAITVPDALHLGELAEVIAGLSSTDNARLEALLANATAKEQEKFRALYARRANSCSYGEKRWFVLMIMLSLDADLYVLDEPTAGVDPEYRFYIWEALAAIKAMGKMIVFSTHQASEIDHNCDYFYFLRNGQATRFETTTELLLENDATSLE